MTDLRAALLALPRLWWCAGWGTLNATRYHGNDEPCHLGPGGTCGEVAYVRDTDLRAALASPADPPTEPDGKSTANDAKISRPADPPSDDAGRRQTYKFGSGDRCGACGWGLYAHECPVPADPDMEERLTLDIHEERFGTRPTPHADIDAVLRCGCHRLAARLIAQGWRRP